MSLIVHVVKPTFYVFFVGFATNESKIILLEQLLIDIDLINIHIYELYFSNIKGSISYEREGKSTS